LFFAPSLTVGFRPPGFRPRTSEVGTDLRAVRVCGRGAFGEIALPRRCLIEVGFSGCPGSLPVVDAWTPQHPFAGHVCHMPFQGHRLPRLGFLLRRVHSVLAPHPANPLQKLPPPSVTPYLCPPDLAERIHPSLDDVKPVLHQSYPPQVDAHPIVEAGSRVDDPLLGGLGKSVGANQFRRKSSQKRGNL